MWGLFAASILPHAATYDKKIKLGLAQ
jgi:hypothetical protein